MIGGYVRAAVGVAIVLVACDEQKKPPPPAPDAGAAALVAVDAAKVEFVEPDDDVHPVYPDDAGPPDPVAKKLCTALHDVQENRRAACCAEKPGVLLTSECVRIVSAALALKGIAIEPADVDKCASAVDKTYDGCDWVGPFPPDVPDACLGVVKGQLAAGKRCRSSLECSGDMRCHGLSPTTAGRCGPAGADDQRCGGSADTLATYTRQSDTDVRHPECKGYCNRTKCAPLVEIDGPCTIAAACGSGKMCVAGKCANATPGRVGQSCPGGECEKGAICVKGKCAARKPNGEKCETDYECIAGCVKKGDAGTSGLCGKKCGVR